jgi:hypothetical protein
MTATTVNTSSGQKAYATVSTTALPHALNLQSSVRFPEYMRLPRNGHADPFFGLKRSKLNELILPSKLNSFRPPVKSFCLREPGKQKGVRLIVFESLRTYLKTIEEEQIGALYSAAPGPEPPRGELNPAHGSSTGSPTASTAPQISP